RDRVAAARAQQESRNDGRDHRRGRDRQLGRRRRKRDRAQRQAQIMSGQPIAFYIALSLFAGVLIPIMAALSGAMGRALGNAQIASLLVITGAFLMVLAFTLATAGQGFSWARLSDATPLQLVSGLAMAFY